MVQQVKFDKVKKQQPRERFPSKLIPLRSTDSLGILS